MSMDMDPNIFMKNMNLGGDEVMQSFSKIDFEQIKSGVLGVKGGGDELDMEKLPKLQG